MNSLNAYRLYRDPTSENSEALAKDAESAIQQIHDGLSLVGHLTWHAATFAPGELAMDRVAHIGAFVEFLADQLIVLSFIESNALFNHREQLIAKQKMEKASAAAPAKVEKSK